MAAKTPSDKAVGKNSFIVMFFTLVSRLLGIVRIRVFSSVFGASSVADAINFSFGIPNNFRKLFSEGALSSAVVPEFSKLENDKERLGRLFSSFLGLQLVIALGILGLTAALRKPIVLFLSDFSDASENMLASGLLPYFSIFLVFILLSSYFSSVLQSKQAFLVQSIAPLFYSTAVIASILLFTGRLGPYSMALGAVSGSFLQMLCTGLRLRALGVKLSVSFDFKSEDFKAVSEKWVPALLSSGLAIISTQAAFYFVSGMGEGAVTAFSNSLTYWQTPYGIVFTAVSTVIVPIMSRAKGTEMALTYEDGLKRLLNFLIPSAVFLFFFRSEAVAVILQTGKFTLENSLYTGKVLGVFLIAMPIVAFNAFTQKLFYCLSLQKTVLKTGILCCALDIVVTIVCIKLGLQVLSPAVATGVSNLTGLIILWTVLRKPLKEFSLGPVLKHWGKVSLGVLPMAAFCLALKAYVPPYWKQGSTLLNLGIFLLEGLGAAALVLGVYRIEKIKLF